MVIQAKDYSAINLRMKREMASDPSLYGTVVTGSPNPKLLNFTSETLRSSPEFVRSQIGRSNRLPGPRRRVHAAAAGAINLDLAPGPQLEEWIEMAMAETFQSALGISAITISAVASDNSLNGSGGSEFADVRAGQWIQVKGFSTAENNTDGQSGRPWGAFVESKPSNAKIILAYHTLVDEAAGQTVTVEGQACANGTKLISATIEREQSDASTDRFQHYPGVVVSSFEFQFRFNEILKAVANVVAQAVRASSGTPASGKSSTSVWDGETSDTEDVMDSMTDASNNLKMFREGGALDGNVKVFTVSHALNLSPVMIIDTTSPEGQSLGTYGLTGTLEGHLVDGSARVQSAFGSSATDFHVMVIPDTAAHSSTVPIYVVTVFRAKFNELGDVPKEDNNGPVAFNLGWEGEESSDYADKWFQVTRLPTV